MIVVLKPGSTEEDIKKVVKLAESYNLKCHISKGQERTVIGIIGDDRYVVADKFESLDCVENVVRVLKPYKLVSREFKPEDTVIDLGKVKIGDGYFTIMAGPCAVEDREMLMETAHFLKEMGVSILRGGAYKPRTSPYSFQGLGEKGLEYLREAADEYGMFVVTEALGEEELSKVAEYADIIQIGARNAQNFRLLSKAGNYNKPVLLKRGFMNTVEEFLLSAEYIANSGNAKIILCERGIRTFEKATRNTLDISAVPVIKKESHLPILVDPSHSGGRRDLVVPLSKAAIAVGAHGIMVEVHPNPERALSDGKQSLDFKLFEELIKEMKRLAVALGVKVN
ncbi:3-deoxy-7-phosphoheptulonate synthase [Thermotoga sp. KOL6]|uniref:3-deoxy-7-phosphoheptulonate synthase n=1 Tax=Thermotoga sp. KOL6 TaxID=126741 RepID=UPI000C78D32A|nr:3-deoxy-7-phosphoheptulonate synthase [Thermotoga sp. KOL6]PLV59085.1 3-deoxy-7-phosphoheptulonate synthase [Thermotoga sp. KOL6]